MFNFHIKINATQPAYVDNHTKPSSCRDAMNTNVCGGIYLGNGLRYIPGDGVRFMPIDDSGARYVPGYGTTSSQDIKIREAYDRSCEGTWMF